MKGDNKGTLADLSFMVQGNISLLWIQECFKPDNQDRKLKDVLSEFITINDNINLYNNPGMLLMASYLFFVYAKEKDFIGRDYSFADTSKFEVLECEKEKRNSNYICRRIRNALAHSRVHIGENGLITFEDFKPEGTKRLDYFKCTISYTDFGNFISAFYHGVKDRYFSNRV
ncbi:HEPN family nuclease [Bacillus mycoides]|uniref:HEPN family nuclease n=1 Tax=Bacillus mycoides TaxID=1405 RepID=UPI002733E43F|nr:HEPN family nuclease [Bacillus mycoides]